jgi:hypothetical protein
MGRNVPVSLGEEEENKWKSRDQQYRRRRAKARAEPPKDQLDPRPVRSTVPPATFRRGGAERRWRPIQFSQHHQGIERREQWARSIIDGFVCSVQTFAAFFRAVSSQYQAHLSTAAQSTVLAGMCTHRWWDSWTSHQRRIVNVRRAGFAVIEAHTWRKSAVSLPLSLVMEWGRRSDRIGGMLRPRRRVSTQGGRYSVGHNVGSFEPSKVVRRRQNDFSVHF